MRNRGFIVGLAVAGAVVAAVPAARAFTITPTFSTGTSQVWDATSMGIVNQAIGDWTCMLSYTDPNQNIPMLFIFQHGGTDPFAANAYLGHWQQSVHGTAGDSLTPWSPDVMHAVLVNSDFMTVRNGGVNYPDYLVMTFSPALPTANQWDGLTVIRRTIGQALGFTMQYADSLGMVSGPNKWQDQVTITGSNAVFDQTPGGLNIPLASSSNVVQFADSTDLMGQGALATGTRVGIGFQDLEALSLAYGYAITVPAGTSFNSPTFKTQTITVNGTVTVASGNAAAGTPGRRTHLAEFLDGDERSAGYFEPRADYPRGIDTRPDAALVAAGQITSSTLATGMMLSSGTAGAINVSMFDGDAVSPTDILIKATYAGDANLDGHVDLTDLSTVLNNFGKTTPDWTSGNFDGATTIDLTDLSAVLNNFGKSVPSGSLMAGQTLSIATPEPGSLAMLASAGGVVAAAEVAAGLRVVERDRGQSAAVLVPVAFVAFFALGGGFLIEFLLFAIGDAVFARAQALTSRRSLR